MDTQRLLAFLSQAEQLKHRTRHNIGEDGRRESVAEHCWRAALMAYFLRDEFPEADMGKVMLMCILHDLGESFTGDIPTFDKTQADEVREEDLLSRWLTSLPEPYATEMAGLFEEMAQRSTIEAKIFKAIDGLEALIQHNESDLSTWIPREYELNLTYAQDKTAFSPYLAALRQDIREETLRKMEREGQPEACR